MNGICDWCYTLNVPELLVNKIGFACNFIANEEPNSNGILDFERIFYHAIHCPFPMRSEHAIALNLTEFISWCFPFFIEMNYFWFRNTAYFQQKNAVHSMNLAWKTLPQHLIHFIHITWKLEIHWSISQHSRTIVILNVPKKNGKNELNNREKWTSKNCNERESLSVFNNHLMLPHERVMWLKIDTFVGIRLSSFLSLFTSLV